MPTEQQSWLKRYEYLLCCKPSITENTTEKELNN